MNIFGSDKKTFSQIVNKENKFKYLSPNCNPLDCDLGFLLRQIGKEVIYKSFNEVFLNNRTIN